MSPGPSLATIIRNTISKNRLGGIVTAVGHGLGVGIYALFALLGLEFLLKMYPEIFFGLQILGLVALILIGISFYFSAKESELLKENTVDKTAFFQGFAISFLNPKIFIFFAALYSQFISENLTNYEKIIMVLTPGIIDTLWYILIAVFLSLTSINKLIISKKVFIEKSMGVFLIIIAFTILYGLI
tara:strand:- start:2941 stop:3498 length:558 start_codon:yes stop_codon:yes gene_type:complete